ncbi:hypothetical protein JL720_17244 [Aureococcus anophagefferens]|nr:hypothetical protein JL720_17244 [Aureococcus anophagefferens]
MADFSKEDLMMLHFYWQSEDGSQQGPSDVAELKRAWKSKQLHKDCHVYGDDGFDDWMTIADLPILKKLIAPPPPPPRRKKAPAAPRRRRAAERLGLPAAKPGPRAKRRPSSTSTRTLSGSSWMKKLTCDLVPYYFNRATGEVAWNTPGELRSSADRGDGATWAWLPDAAEGWVACRSLGGGAYETAEGAARTLKRNEKALPLDKPSLSRVHGDLVLLDSLDEGLMLHNLRVRFLRDEIYTGVGDIVGGQQAHARAPYKLAKAAVGALVEDATRNQSILVSGESGAGKTEATKQCLSFLAEVAGSSGDIEQRVLGANPILEAFGNAKTTRNDNSSRFGRFSELQLDARLRIAGAKVTNYLLEKSRVKGQSDDERNYHAFYQLCAAPVGARDYGVGDAGSYGYLRKCLEVRGIDDGADFDDVADATASLGFDDAQRSTVWGLVAGILKLGQVGFAALGGMSDGSAVDGGSAAVLAEVAAHLGVDGAVLGDALTHRTLSIRGQDDMALFNEHTFKTEAATYEREGVPFPPIDFVDNQPICDLIEKRGGILTLLDDTVKGPGKPEQKDAKFSQNLDQACRANAFFVPANDHRGVRGAVFSVRHYAGTVCYSCDGFVEKNADTLYKDLYDCLSASGNGLIAAISALMETLRSTDPHYIRCVKPNQPKRARLFEGAAVLEQLRCAGVFEATAIRKQGYPFRFDAAVVRYKSIMSTGAGWVPFASTDDRQRLEAALRATDEALGVFAQFEVSVPIAEWAACKEKVLIIKEARLALLLEHACEPDDETLLEDDAALSALMRVLDVDCAELAAKGPCVEPTFDQWHTYATQRFHERREAKLGPKFATVLQTLERDDMAELYASAKQFGYEHAGLAEIESLLGASEEQRLKRQYARAHQNGDAGRAMGKEIALKELYLDNYAALFTFEKFALLRDPDEYAAAGGFLAGHRKEKADTMLTYSTHKLLTSLTALDPKLKKDALRANRNIMGFMGEKQGRTRVIQRRFNVSEKRSYASADLCVDVVAAGLASPELRMEILCQLMKQLNGNGNSESAHKGWTLALMCVLYWPAEPQLENYLHIFVRDHAPDDLKAILTRQIHAIAYADARAGAPTLDEPRPVRGRGPLPGLAPPLLPDQPMNR